MTPVASTGSGRIRFPARSITLVPEDGWNVTDGSGRRREPRRARTGGARVAVHRDVRLGSAELLPDIDRTDTWLLFIDGVPQSGVDLADPGYLEFEYVRRIGHAADLAFPAGQPLRVLHLGGGALTLPRYLQHTRPGSRQLVAELDDALTALVRGHLPLPAGHRIRVRTADARAVAESVRAASYDLVIADIFAGAVTPPHLTTAEFAAATARALRPGGVYAVNVASGALISQGRPRAPGARPMAPPSYRSARSSHRGAGMSGEIFHTSGTPSLDAERGQQLPPSVRNTRKRA